VFNANQIVLVNKPEGISSFGVVAKVRGWLRAKNDGQKVKVGHTGTLDPFATGLLILLSGKNTKIADTFLKKDKQYITVLLLGATSSTGDKTGELSKTNITTSEIPSDKIVQNVLKKFIGEITQTPPIHSAIKINGQRAYKLARRGETPKMPVRKITIYSMEIIKYSWPELKIKVDCSSGTYIRSLAQDIGKELKTGAYCEALQRSKVGEFSIVDAKPLSYFEK